jgi:lipopolysaccharide export system protein LptA
MAPSPRNAVLAAVWLACAQAGAAAEPQDRSSLPILVDAASSDVDFKSKTVVYKDVVITQGDIRVQAQKARASGDLNLDNTRWILEGKVNIRVEQRGSLSSDQAIVDFQNNRISRATITGSPAQFEQQLTDAKGTARGRAGEIVYEVNTGTVRLANDAWVSDGRTEISGPLIVYDIRAEQVQAASKPGEKERVRITIGPKPEKP